ncbi:preprotein translocase subunit SecY [Streptococcus hillyeri]|uniref:Protein translocase subunit SecY n=1 Tax=Streptococcus hillyeri TaxID=2282420 RepID=A0A3L9DKN5_9STRE|nr:preprotein translocase subunit SecY [Streptococcus hillyeri]RLY01334.1 preprotein translocase subunit SecY [Streptococcus hillyeri]
MFFKLLKDALKVKHVRRKILFTIFIIFVFRLGTHITVPGVNVKSLEQLGDLPFLNMLNLVSGNAMNNFSVFSLGVSPYITASIVVQLLQMDILPKFVEWGKQGEVGRRKLNQATRYISLFLAFFQSIGITYGFNALSSVALVPTPNPQTYILIGAILTTGSVVVTWLGEQITDKGFGNGVSMIIFSGIVSALPNTISSIYDDYFVNVRSSDLQSSYLFIAGLIVAALIIIFFTTFVQQAEYKIPIQYTKLTKGASTSSYLPLKINPAGVIPVIFASSITALPSTIIPFVQSQGWNLSWLSSVQSAFDYRTPVGMVVYAILIVVFSFFYTFVQVNPEKTAENLQKNASYIPKVRPGRETEQYLTSLLKKLATLGAIFLAFVALSPILAQQLYGLSAGVALGGTSLLILISTAIEGMKQLEGYLLKRKYAGFMNVED